MLKINCSKDIGHNINTSIIEHKRAYECAGMQPPTYRITCKEHKALLEYIKPITYHENEPAMITKYCGINIEVVMIVDEYS